jgi:hypothetical protein
MCCANISVHIIMAPCQQENCTDAFLLRCAITIHGSIVEEAKMLYGLAVEASCQIIFDNCQDREWQEAEPDNPCSNGSSAGVCPDDDAECEDGKDDVVDY